MGAHELGLNEIAMRQNPKETGAALFWNFLCGATLHGNEKNKPELRPHLTPST